MEILYYCFRDLKIIKSFNYVAANSSLVMKVHTTQEWHSFEDHIRVISQERKGNIKLGIVPVVFIYAAILDDPCSLHFLLVDLVQSKPALLRM